MPFFKSKPTKLEKYLPWLLIIAGIIALLASILLTNEVFMRLKNPAYVPACNLNPIFSCTNVADSSQAHAFGFPNYFLGIAGYAALTTVGVALLAGAKFKKWFWQVVQTGMVLAIAFITWLQFETLYRIGALCLFCMIVWAATMPAFWYTTLYNLQAGNINLPKRLVPAGKLARKYHLEILTIWFLLIIALILKRFWYYWKTL